MNVFIVSWMVFAGVFIFVGGLVFGKRLHKESNERKESRHFGEAVRLWQRSVDSLDEWSRRNVAEFQSVRKKLVNIDLSIKDTFITDTIDALTKQIGRIEKSSQLFSQASTKLPLEEGTFGKTATTQNTTNLCEKKSTKSISENPLAIAELLSDITEAVNRKMPRDALLGLAYEGLQKFVPFQRMGFAEIDYDADRVSAVWCQSDRQTKLKGGYSATLSKSSLRFIAEQNRPRVLNNLSDYLRRHPDSDSTRLIVNEGFHSSLTFPVVFKDTVAAFLFLSSVDAGAFANEDVLLVECVAQTLFGTPLKPLHSSDLEICLSHEAAKSPAALNA